jgi:hypothetical protein
MATITIATNAEQKWTKKGARGMKYKYLITPHVGEPVLIVAPSRMAAIAAYSAKTGMPEDFFKRHCKIKNLGACGKEQDNG